MQLTTVIKNGVHAAGQLNFNSIDEARSWIGRRLVLQKTLLGFEPGTRCVVMCVVDFGDGLLLWIVTDDSRSLDIEQIELPLLFEYFQPSLSDPLVLSSSDNISLGHF